jgi:peptidoglycan/xylan/chitin deacetylase (PgdA/CDA1 family)
MVLANLPQRLKKSWVNWQKQFSPKALILMYHRVANSEIDPWELSVSPENFEEHLKILKKQTQLMSLEEFSQAHQQGKMPEKAAVITFDDGYADNLYYAKPILDKYQVPATVFIATGYTGRSREFWWDELENILFQTQPLPEKLTLTLRGKVYEWELGNAINYTIADKQKDRDRRAWEGKPGSRMYFYHSVWQELSILEDHEREKALQDLSQWANYQPIPRRDYCPMTPEQLQTLESSGYIEIGAHTVNHVALSSHSKEIQKGEIEESKAYLEKLLNHHVTTFTYPFGNYDKHSISLVKTAQFICACSTIEETVWRGDNRFLLPRCGVANWNGQEFSEKIQEWFSK